MAGVAIRVQRARLRQASLSSFHALPACLLADHQPITRAFQPAGMTIASPPELGQQSTVEDELATYARALAILQNPGWASASGRFHREFRLVRNHLAPIRSRHMLAASFGRESFRSREPISVETALSRLAVSAVHAAYAMRWLELGDEAEVGGSGPGAP